LGVEVYLVLSFQFLLTNLFKKMEEQMMFYLAFQIYYSINIPIYFII